MKIEKIRFKKVYSEELILAKKGEPSHSDADKFPINKQKIQTLKSNPFFASENMPLQILALVNNTVAGSVICFPSKIIAQNVIYTCSSGSSLYVDPKYRGNGLGTKLSLKRLNVSSNKISLAAGLSSMSLPIFKKLGCSIFYPERYIIILQSKAILNRWIKGKVLNIITLTVDFLLRLQTLIINNFISIFLSKFTVVEIQQATSDIEKIIDMDTHPYKELHTQAWFDWHLNNSFSEHPSSKQHLYLVKKGNQNVAFFMTKIRHKETVQKKFKNLLLGSIIEWGSIDTNIIKDKYLFLMAIRTLKGKADMIDITTDDRNTIRFLKKFGCLRIGRGNFSVYVGKDSPLRQHTGYNEQHNWRIRPATSDNGLS